MIWSADSNYLVYPDDTTLKRIRVPDGAPEIIGRLPAPFPAGSMSESGMLLFFCCAPGPTRVWLLPARDAQAAEIRVPGLPEGTPFGPHFLPNGEDFLLGFVPQGSEENEIYLVSLRDGKPTDAVLLMRNAAGVRYTPAGGGRVLFVRDDNLYAQTLNRRDRSSREIRS